MAFSSSAAAPRGSAVRRDRRETPSPPLRRFYDLLAARLPNPDLLFLNYGYADMGPDAYNWVLPRDARYKYHLSLVRHVLDGIDVRGKRVLELGSGRGGNCYYLATYARAGAVCGVEPCEGNLRICRENPRLGGIRFVQAEVERLPIADRAFDVVLSLEASHCYEDFEAFLQQVQRVLAPAGIFCCADLWDLDVLPVDWASRRALLASSTAFTPLTPEEDISAQVYDALRQEDGFASLVRTLAEGEDGFVSDILRTIEAMRLSLALSFCSYRIWRFRLA